MSCVCVSSCMRLQNYFEKFRIQILLGGLKKFLLHFWSPVETISLCPTLFIHLPYSRINGWHPRNSIFKLIISEWFSDTLESTQRKSRKLVKTRKCTPPPSSLPLRHSFATCRHQTCFSPWILWIMRLTLWANSKYLPGQNFEKFDQNIGKCRYGSNMCCTGRGLGNVKTFSIFQQQTKKCGGPV